MADSPWLDPVNLDHLRAAARDAGIAKGGVVRKPRTLKADHAELLRSGYVTLRDLDLLSDAELDDLVAVHQARKVFGVPLTVVNLSRRRKIASYLRQQCRKLLRVHQVERSA